MTEQLFYFMPVGLLGAFGFTLIGDMNWRILAAAACFVVAGVWYSLARVFIQGDPFARSSDLAAPEEQEP